MMNQMKLLRKWRIHQIWTNLTNSSKLQIYW